MDTIVIIVLIVLFLGGFALGMVSLVSLKSLVDKFYSHKEDIFHVPRSFFLGRVRFIGAGFAIGCAFALYNIIVIFL